MKKIVAICLDTTQCFKN